MLLYEVQRENSSDPLYVCGVLESLNQPGTWNFSFFPFTFGFSQLVEVVNIFKKKGTHAMWYAWNRNLSRRPESTSTCLREGRATAASQAITLAALASLMVDG